jgi:hypothetical protein
MKIKEMIFSTCLLAVSVLVVASCGGDSGKWIAKVGGDEIKLGAFNDMYYAQNKQVYGYIDVTNEDIDKRALNPEESSRNPYLDKRNFLEATISQKLVYKKAVKDDILKDKDLVLLLDMAREQAIIQYYLLKKFKDQLTVTDQDIAKVYAEQKARFKNVPVEQAEQYIRQNLMQQKLQMKSKELVDSLKEEGGIKRNLDLIGVASKSDKKEDTAVKAEKPAPPKEEPKK